MNFKDKRNRNIELSEYGEFTVLAHDLRTRLRVTKFEFLPIALDKYNDTILLVAHMETPGGINYRRSGIGRKIMEFTYKLYGHPIVFRRPDGRRYDDGSHLIDDGPGFATSMAENYEFVDFF